MEREEFQGGFVTAWTSLEMSTSEEQHRFGDKVREAKPRWFGHVQR